MSMNSLPLLFINLGGEMMYILDQRLRAQNIPDEKAKKVLHDIIGTMFHRRFMDELFKPQTLYSKKAMRTVFDRLAHASIMRLNAASMDKLYDLMTMAFKYQVSLSLRSNDLLLISLNHMDAVRKFVGGDPSVSQLVEHVYKLLIENYASLTDGQFHKIRQNLLYFFQDMHIRVSIFLKDKVQNNNGRFVLPLSGTLPWGNEVPGTIRLFSSKGDHMKFKTVEFSPGGSYSPAEKEGSYAMKGARVTKLGTNMYSNSRPFETMVSGGSKTTIRGSDLDSSVPDPLARAHLDLLSHLIRGAASSRKQEIRLNLFKSDEEEEQAAAMRPYESPDSQFIKIDASKKKQHSELNRIMGEMSVNDDGAEYDSDDLLDLMDS